MGTIEQFIARLRAAARPDECYALTFSETFRGDGYSTVTTKRPDIYVTKWTYLPVRSDCQGVAHGETIEEVIEQFEAWIARRNETERQQGDVSN